MRSNRDQIPLSETTDVALNIGCGTSCAPGWVNIDNSPTVLLSRVPLVRWWVTKWPRNVIREDAAELPFDSESVAYIYSSHMLEHLEYDKAVSVVKEWHRVLRPGGILRIAVPDLRTIVQDYLNDTSSQASHRFIDRLQLKYDWRSILHSGAHHRCMYDDASLGELLRGAGFTDLAVRQWGDSAIPDLSSVEPHSRASESLYMEATRPYAASRGNGDYEPGGAP